MPERPQTTPAEVLPTGPAGAHSWPRLLTFPARGARVHPVTPVISRNSATSRSRSSAQELFEADCVLVHPGFGLGVGGCLRPHVGHRLFGIGQHERPAVILDHLDAVDQ